MWNPAHHAASLFNLRKYSFSRAVQSPQVFFQLHCSISASILSFFQLHCSSVQALQVIFQLRWSISASIRSAALSNLRKYAFSCAVQCSISASIRIYHVIAPPSSRALLAHLLQVIFQLHCSITASNLSAALFNLLCNSSPIFDSATPPSSML
jgi:hypothetical protein